MVIVAHDLWDNRRVQQVGEAQLPVAQFFLDRLERLIGRLHLVSQGFATGE